MNILPYDNSGLGGIYYLNEREGYSIFVDSVTGECFQLEDNEYVLTDCPSSQNLATVNVKIPPADTPAVKKKTDYTLPLLAGGLLILLLLER